MTRVAVALDATPPTGRRGWLRVLASWVVAATVLTFAGCFPADTDEPVPPSVPTIDVRLADDNLAFDEPVPAGRVVFRITNTGERDHRLSLFPLPDDAPPIQEEVTDEYERPVRFLARVPNLSPGDTGEFAVDLAADQRYAMVDYSEAPDGTQHMTLGVAGEFTTKDEDPATPSPSQDSP